MMTTNHSRWRLWCRTPRHHRPTCRPVQVVGALSGSSRVVVRRHRGNGWATTTCPASELREIAEDVRGAEVVWGRRVGVTECE
jgi:hypothetical protein